MHSIIDVIVVASVGFLGTMFDNFFAFSAQLVVTDRARFRRVSWAQALGVFTLIIIAAGVGSVLAPIPTRWIGLLCVAPWVLAVHAWRRRDGPARTQFRRGSLTTYTMTLALGGDNLAVWIPLLRIGGSVGGITSAVVFLGWEVLFLLAAQTLAGHPRVVEWGKTRGPRLVPFVYLILGALILIESGTFT